jgi:SpoVK/Ycf46/Vps4 family AAA+-type ATPase
MRVLEAQHSHESACAPCPPHARGAGGCPQAAAGGGEPSDAIRAVNALLTQLDQLRRFPNVMVLTTSNITEAIDVAFVDRADIKVGEGKGGGVQERRQWSS